MENTQHAAIPGPSAELPELLAHYSGVFARRWRLVALTSAGFLLLGILYLATARRTYQATSSLVILQQGSRPISVPNDSHRGLEFNDDYIPTQMLVVGSPMVLARAIETAGLDDLPTLRAAKAKGLDPVEEAAAALKIDRPDRMAKVLRL